MSYNINFSNFSCSDIFLSPLLPAALIISQALICRNEFGLWVPSHAIKLNGIIQNFMIECPCTYTLSILQKEMMMGFFETIRLIVDSKDRTFDRVTLARELGVGCDSVGWMRLDVGKGMDILLQNKEHGISLFPAD